MPLPPTFAARLTRARALSPSVRELVFEREDGQPMVFEPGQWVNALPPASSVGPVVVAGDSGGLAAPVKRSYSIASAPDGSSSFEIAVTRVQGGPVSTWLHAIDPGERLAFSGPQGFFTRPAQDLPPSLFVATGTGVTPMRSMLRAATAAGARAPSWLLLGVRHEEDMLYADEFVRLARERPWFRFEATLSQPRAEWAGLRGYVQTHVPRLWQELVDASGTEPHAYVCGLQRMVGSVRDLLRKELGVPRQRVHSERYD